MKKFQFLEVLARRSVAPKIHLPAHKKNKTQDILPRAHPNSIGKTTKMISRTTFFVPNPRPSHAVVCISAGSPFTCLTVPLRLQACYLHTINYPPSCLIRTGRERAFAAAASTLTKIHSERTG